MLSFIIIFLIWGFGSLQPFFAAAAPFDDIYFTVLTIFLLHLGLLMLFLAQRNKLKAIVEWMEEWSNRQRLDQFTRTHPQSPFTSPVGLATKCHQFEVVTSLVIFTSRIQVFATGKSVIPVGVIASLWSFVFGWWALPFGIIHTPKAIWKNIKGGTTEKLGDLPKWKESWLEIF